MSYEVTVRTVLAADATLVALLTGGVYARRDKRIGVNRKNTPTAYNTTGIMKPHAVVKGRTVQGMGVKDASNQFRSTRQAVEIYIRNDGDAGFTVIQQAVTRINQLLDQKQIAGIYKAQWRGQLDYNDPDLNEAATIRLEYDLVGSQKGS